MNHSDTNEIMHEHHGWDKRVFDFNKLMENPDPTKIPRKWQCAEELEKWYKKLEEENK